MPPFWSLFVIVLLSTKRITNKDNHGHMIFSAQACITAKHAKTAGALLARHFPSSQGTDLFAASLTLSFLSGVEKGSKDRKIAELWRDVQCVTQPFFFGSAGGIVAHHHAMMEREQLSSSAMGQHQYPRLQCG